MDTVTPEQLAAMPQDVRNRLAIPQEEWQRYLGQWIVLSSDSSRIIAGDPDPLRLDARIVELGENPEEVIFEFVPDPNENFIWG